MKLEIRDQFNVGIDPGKNGAIVVENMNYPSGAAFWNVKDTPASSEGQFGIRWHIFDLHDFLDPHDNFDLNLVWGFFAALADECVVSAIEKVGAMPRNQGMFQFGFGAGILQMAHCAASIEFINPTPQFWKAQMEIPKEFRADKNYARGYAAGICPELEPFLSRIKDADRAEAFLLSQFAFKVGEGEISMPTPRKPPAKKAKTKKKTKSSAGSTTGRKAA